LQVQKHEMMATLSLVMDVVINELLNLDILEQPKDHLEHLYEEIPLLLVQKHETTGTLLAEMDDQ
jgi:hypothetical protein